MAEHIKDYQKVIRLLKQLAYESGYEIEFTDVDIELIGKKLIITGNKK
jgi:uncharacterized protein YihD (DUF1040 family)